MEKWDGWLSFKQAVLFSTKCVLHKITSGFRSNNKGRRDVLQSLYKDMESCQEYEDIQVMWAIIHSSACPPKSCNNTKRNKRPSYWRFCFRPT